VAEQLSEAPAVIDNAERSRFELYAVNSPGLSTGATEIGWC
jgi:hypothetical protein